MGVANGQAKRVLIVEDEALIGLTLADLLRDEGFLVAGPVGSRSEAVAALDRSRPDAVVLDLTLTDGVCGGLVRELHARGVPFLVFSGHHRREGFDFPALQDAPWFEKPGHGDEIIAALRRMTADARPSAASPAPSPSGTAD